MYLYMYNVGVWAMDAQFCTPFSYPPIGIMVSWRHQPTTFGLTRPSGGAKLRHGCIRCERCKKRRAMLNPTKIWDITPKIR